MTPRQAGEGGGSAPVAMLQGLQLHAPSGAGAAGGHPAASPWLPPPVLAAGAALPQRPAARPCRPEEMPPDAAAGQPWATCLQSPAARLARSSVRHVLKQHVGCQLLVLVTRQVGLDAVATAEPQGLHAGVVAGWGWWGEGEGRARHVGAAAGTQAARLAGAGGAVPPLVRRCPLPSKAGLVSPRGLCLAASCSPSPGGPHLQALDRCVLLLCQLDLQPGSRCCCNALRGSSGGCRLAGAGPLTAQQAGRRSPPSSRQAASSTRATAAAAPPAPCRRPCRRQPCPPYRPQPPSSPAAWPHPPRLHGGGRGQGQGSIWGLRPHHVGAVHASLGTGQLFRRAVARPPRTPHLAAP